MSLTEEKLQREEHNKVIPFLLIYLFIYLFILFYFINVLEEVFQIVVFSDSFPSNIKSFEIFQKKFIYTAYADDTTFFIKKLIVIYLLTIFKYFS